MSSRQISPSDPILIGEKDSVESQNLVRALMELGFRNVTHVNSAYKFLQYARVQKFSMVFIASSLGRAVETLGSLRTGSENAQTPAVLIFSKSEKSLIKVAMGAGASGTMEYPLGNPRLRTLLEGLFDMYIVPKAEEAVKANGAAKSNGAAAPPQKDSDGDLDLSKSLGAAFAAGTAREMLAQGKLEEAEKLLVQALEAEKGSTELYFNLAEVYLARGDHEAAEKALKEADRIQPFVRREFRRRAPVFVRRGRQKLKEKSYDEAILEFKGAIAANPKSVAGYFGLGEALRAMGDEEGAEQVFQHALALDEEPVDVHLYNEMGLAARRKQEFATALFAFDKAISFAPDDAVLYYNKAMVFVAQKNYGAALPVLQKAVSLDPEFVEAGQAESAISHILSGLRESSAA